MHPSACLLTWIFAVLFLTVIGAKYSSWKSAEPPVGFMEFLLKSPVLSVPSWKKRTRYNKEMVRSLVLQIILLGVLVILGFEINSGLVRKLHPSILGKCYLALIPSYLLGQFLSKVLELLYLGTGWHYPGHFQYPPLSRSLAEFWNGRWATWVSDFMNQMVFSRYRREPALGVIWVFFYSGLWHEILINLPLFLFYGVNVLGTQMAFFLIQAGALLLERKLRIKSQILRRAYVYFVILVPGPLVINEGVLRAMGLY